MAIIPVFGDYAAESVTRIVPEGPGRSSESDYFGLRGENHGIDPNLAPRGANTGLSSKFRLELRLDLQVPLQRNSTHHWVYRIEGTDTGDIELILF